MRRKIILISSLLIVILIVFAAGATVHPQVSVDEQNAIVNSVIQTINPQGMMDSIEATVESKVLQQINIAASGNNTVALTPVLTEISNTANQSTPVSSNPTVAATPTIAGTRPYTVGIPTEYWNGAVLQPDGTYKGLHAKFVNSYAYTTGADDAGNATKEFKSEYTPNTLFNVDFVFENDGSVVWPAQLELRWIGTSGTYTGHSPSIFIDRTYDPIKPGDRCGFSLAAHGSEDLGYITFYFQMYDALSGSVIEGGNGSFSYLAK